MTILNRFMKVKLQYTSMKHLIVIISIAKRYYFLVLLQVCYLFHTQITKWNKLLNMQNSMNLHPMIIIAYKSNKFVANSISCIHEKKNWQNMSDLE